MKYTISNLKQLVHLLPEFSEKEQILDYINKLENELTSYYTDVRTGHGKHEHNNHCYCHIMIKQLLNKR